MYSKIARIDPATLEVREFTTPAAGSRIRRLDMISDGSIYYGDSRGYLVTIGPAR